MRHKSHEFRRLARARSVAGMCKKQTELSTVMMKCNGLLVLKILDAGISVWVHKRKKYMMHN